MRKATLAEKVVVFGFGFGLVILSVVLLFIAYLDGQLSW